MMEQLIKENAGVALLIKQQWAQRLDNRAILIFACTVSHLRFHLKMDRDQIIAFFALAIGRDISNEQDKEYVTQEFEYLMGEMDVRGVYG